MMGDYFRYVAESAHDDKLEEVKSGALEGYQQSQSHSTELNACNPIKLGLALNFSVFYYEIMEESAKACELAKSAFDSAIQKLDDIEQETYKDSTLIMQLLRDNLTLWTSDQDPAGENEEAGE